MHGRYSSRSDRMSIARALNRGAEEVEIRRQRGRGAGAGPRCLIRRIRAHLDGYFGRPAPWGASRAQLAAALSALERAEGRPAADDWRRGDAELEEPGVTVDRRTVPDGCELWDTGIVALTEPRSRARHEPQTAGPMPTTPAGDVPLSVALDRQVRRLRGLDGVRGGIAPRGAL